MALVSVALPGPWWTHLTYQNEKALPEGLRVRVPLGASVRVGITVSSDEPPVGEIKNVSDVIDEACPLPPELWETIKYFGKTWFVGTGLAAKTILPNKFFQNEPLVPISFARSSDTPQRALCVYETHDCKRFERYRQILCENPSGTLVLFPEFGGAERFWESLPEDIRALGALYPTASPKKQWKIWNESREGKLSFAVGSQAAAFLPLRGLTRIIIDEEESGSWNTQKYPIFHYRSLLSVRARFARAQLVLGGRMPSSKAFVQVSDKGNDNAGKRLIFVDKHDASSFDVDGVQDILRISKPLVRETLAAFREDKWAFWILDRKGYAAEINCGECGASFKCEKCGEIMRWEWGKRDGLVCIVCGHRTKAPETCPNCGGYRLQGTRPGTDALLMKAKSLFRGERCRVLDQDTEENLSELLQSGEGGVVIGTRKLLRLTDKYEIPVICWLDADLEARSEEFDAKERAFRLIWESVWRGLNPDSRKVIIQSARPARGWQSGLIRGWRTFWNDELKQRELFELPPFIPQIEIAMPKNRGAGLARLLDEQQFEYIVSEESKDKITVRTKQFAKLRKILEAYYNIQKTKYGLPKIFVKTC